MFWTLIEIQRAEGGDPAVVPPVVYTDYDAAMAALYAALAAAARSGLAYHSAHLLRSDGIATDGRVFNRRIAEEE